MTFRERVYTVVSLIPKGKVASYGQIARLSGNPKAARAVGMCMKTNPFAPQVPCHRVVGKNGSLIGYSAKQGLKTKKTLLIAEGISFHKNKVDMHICTWDSI